MTTPESEAQTGRSKTQDVGVHRMADLMWGQMAQFQLPQRIISLALVVTAMEFL